MKITDQFPMIYVVVSDMVRDIERYDAYKGRVWYKPSTWKKPEFKDNRICIEVERRLREYVQPYLGIMARLPWIFHELGYKNGSFPLQDEWDLGDHWSGEIGRRRRILLRELHDHLRVMELGTVAPSENKVGKILA